MAAAAETFLGGGTDYVTPLREAVRLIEQEGYRNADLVFITDGLCELPEDFQKELAEKKRALGFTITGILMGGVEAGMAFSLTPFCEEIYRVDEQGMDVISDTFLGSRI